jgi:membrane protease YdiL (CAAX protease family)
MRTQSSISAKTPSKTQLLIFIGGVAFLSFFFETYIIKEAKSMRSFAMLPLAWIPGLVAIACSYNFGNKFRDLALIKPGKLSMIYAYVIPALCATATLVVLVAIDIGKMKWPTGGFFKIMFVQTTLGVAVSFIMAFGQELGWRGFLHTHLQRARIPEPMIVTGLLWSVWQWPLILFTEHSRSAMPWMSVMLFTIGLTSFSIILGWLREYSRSVYPCALAHAVHITWVQTIYPNFYVPGRLDPYFGGETGFVLPIIYLLIALYLYQRHVATPNY